MKSIIFTFIILISSLGFCSEPFPPAGPSWETDLAKAFAKARDTDGVVLAYVGNEG